MNLVLLAGNSISNKDWIEEIRDRLKSDFESVEILYYSHWETGAETIDLDTEVAKLADLVKDNPEYVIFAKSAGVLVVLKGMYEGKIHPKKCVFLGTAVIWGRNHNLNIDEWIKNYSTPTLFIQKTQDPAIAFDDLKQLLINNNVSAYSLKEIPGEDHSYELDEELKKTVLAFI